MKKELIEKVNLEKKQYETLILNANKEVINIENRLQRLEDGTDDARLREVLKSISTIKCTISGLLFLHDNLTRSLKDLEDHKYSNNDDKTFYTKIKNNLKVNEQELRKSYKTYYQLLREKLEINCTNIGKKRELKEHLNHAKTNASKLTEAEFIKELVRIFHNNSFSNLYDSKENTLNYSLGQIFLIKYAITQLSQYCDLYDFTPNMLRQVRILDDYIFRPSGKNLSYKDFISSLENGNLHLCDFNYPIISYEGALKLYKRLTFTFFLPKQAAYVFKKSLK